ncbi:MAG: protein adenylyltransferase SelO [Acidiferrobacterales bacterium]
MIQIPFDNRYVQLGEPFYEHVAPSAVRHPTLIRFNEALARELGIDFDASDTATLATVFSGNSIPDGAEPLAMAYAGHQFGHFTPQLGDGRAILLGEICTEDRRCFELQLKGAGRTAYSRNGDGRAALGPVLREYLVSEAMHRLNVPTTRALAAVATGEAVIRERALPGGVITRVASSFVRVGTFQYFAARGELDAVKALADHVIAHTYPGIAQAENPYVALLESVTARQARLIAQWMQVGFIHGVMNTDNMSIAGETIDYGPCAFMDTYSHQQVYSSIDHQGRYAYNNQPGIGLWNLTRLAESLLPLLADDTDTSVKIAESILRTFPEQYEHAWLDGMRKKVGLTVVEGREQDDRELIEALFDAMADNKADFTLTFYHLSRMSLETGANEEAAQALFDRPEVFEEWVARWRERLSLEAQGDTERQERMQAVNPVYIPRNHQVEAAIRAAEDEGDFSVFHTLHEVLQQPFTEQAGKASYMQPPQPEEVVEVTFCGT